jgi:hypothetical protein
MRFSLTLTVVAAGLVALMAGAALAQMYVYPARGQTPQRQQQDQGACSQWAMQQAGNPAAVGPPPNTEGQVLQGAGRGALVGVIGGAIGGNAGKGAAIGAASGALIGGFRRADQERAYQDAQAQANASWQRAYAACLEGRGYTVK